MSDTWTSKRVVGPINENEIFSIPLLSSFCTEFRIKPAVRYYRWSKPISCIRNFADFVIRKEFRCESTGVDKEYVIYVDTDSNYFSAKPIIDLMES